MRRFTKRALSVLLTAALLLGIAACRVQPEPTTEPEQLAQQTQPEGTGAYTFRMALSAPPEDWHPHRARTEAETLILHATAPGLYEAIPDASGQTQTVPQMAAAEPVDVTGTYAGRFGVPDTAESGYAWEISLRQDAVWEDGTPIRADTYVESMQKLLDSTQKNSRAAAFSSGTLRLANAYSYSMQDQSGRASYLTLAQAGYDSVDAAESDGISDFYVDMDGFWNMECGWKHIEDGELLRDESVREGLSEDYVSAQYLYRNYLADGGKVSAYQPFYVGIRTELVEEVTWEDVGFLKTGEDRITLVLERPLGQHALMQCLTEGFLIPPGADAAYGTSAAEYCSCGPYRLDRADDQGVYLTRNPNWYGWKDAAFAGRYAATAVDAAVYDHAAAQAAFAAGQLDVLTLETADMDEYCDHPALVLTEQTYTTKLTMNSDFEALQSRQTEGVNKTLLSDTQFRRGICLAIDRAAFTRECVPLNTPAYCLLNGQYLADPECALAYRETAEGRAAEAGAVRERDLEAAAQCIQSAYDAAYARGEITEETRVELELLLYAEGEPYDEMARFLDAAVAAAAEGTDLEGRISIRPVVEPDYYACAQRGAFDLIFSTLGGHALDPWQMLRYYCDPSRCFEYGFLPQVQNCSVELPGGTETRTFFAWYRALDCGIYADADASVRRTILSALESQLLEQMCCIPLYSRRSAAVLGARMDPSGGISLYGLKFLADDAGVVKESPKSGK